MKTRYLAPLFLLIMVLGACGPQPAPSPEGATNTPPQPAPTETSLPPRQTSPLPEPERSPLPQPGQSPISPLPTPPEPSATAAVTFLADELGISPDEITIRSFEPVDWPDTSLGCPQPGMMYAQVITPGYSFLLEVAGEQYELHTDLTGESVALCELPAESLSDPTNDPARAFRSLLTYLTQAFPGFGLDQQTEWAHQDITKAATEGISTWAWRSGEWTMEMTFPAVPQPAYESVVFHQRAGTVWRGTLGAAGLVTPVYESLALSFEVKPCDETIPADTLDEWAGWMSLSRTEASTSISTSRTSAVQNWPFRPGETRTSSA